MHTQVKVTLTPGTDTITIEGPHASLTVSSRQPSEIGLAVLEALTGVRVAPPVSYRDRDNCGRIKLVPVPAPKEEE